MFIKKYCQSLILILLIIKKMKLAIYLIYKITKEVLSIETKMLIKQNNQIEIYLRTI